MKLLLLKGVMLFLACASFGVKEVVSENGATIVSRIEDKLPGLQRVSKDVVITGPPSLQQVRSHRTSVNELIRHLGIETRDKLHSMLPKVDAIRVLRELRPMTLEDLIQVFPNYTINEVFNRLNIQVNQTVNDFINRLNISQQLILAGVPTKEALQNIFPVFTKDDFLNAIGIPSAEAILERLNLTNATAILKELRLPTKEDLKTLLPFNDVQSALGYFGIPTIDELEDRLHIKEIKEQFLEIKEMFSEDVIRGKLHAVRDRLFEELSVPDFDVVRRRIEDELHPDSLLKRAGFPSREEIEAQLAQATGATLVQRLTFPTREHIEIIKQEVSPEKLLHNLGLPSGQWIKEQIANLDENTLLRIAGLPMISEMEELLKRFDPKQITEELNIETVVKLKQVVKSIDVEALLQSFGIPDQETIKSELERLHVNDIDDVLLKLGYPTPSDVKARIQNATDVDRILLHLPLIDQVKDVLSNLSVGNLLSHVGLPNKKTLKDALKITNVRHFLRVANVTTFEELLERFHIPEFGKVISELQLPTIEEVKENFIKPQVHKFLNQIGIPDLKGLGQSVKNFGIDIANEVFQKLGIPTREDLIGKFPKIDAAAILKGLNIPTLDELENRIPNFNLDNLVDKFKLPAKQRLDELAAKFNVTGLLEKAGIPSLKRLKQQLASLLDPDTFLDSLNIPDLDELKDRLNIPNATAILNTLGIPSRDEIKRLLQFRDFDSALKVLGLPNVDDIMEELHIDDIKEAFDEIKNIPKDYIEENLKAIADKVLEEVGIQDFYELQNKIKHVLNPDQILTDLGIPNKKELETIFKQYSGDELLKRLNLPTRDDIENQLKQFSPEVLLDKLGLPTVDEITKHLDILNEDKILEWAGLPSKEKIEKFLTDFHPESILKILNIPTPKELLPKLPELIPDDILKIVGIKSKEDLKKLLDIPDADEILEKLGLPSPDFVKQEIEKLTNPNNLLKEIGLPTLESLKQQLSILNVDNIWKELGLPTKDEILKLVKIPDVKTLLQDVGFPSVDDLIHKLGLPEFNLKSVIEKLNIPTIDEIKEKMNIPDVSDLLEEIGLPRLDEIKGVVDEFKQDLINKVPIVRELAELKEQYAEEIAVVVEVVGYVKDIYDVLRNPERLPALGQKYGAKLGWKFGSAIGSAIAGPIGSVIGGLIGAVVGGFIGRALGSFLCKIFCTRSDPPPDLTPPTVYCPPNVDVAAAALTVVANVAFAQPRAQDDKYGDVSSTIRIDVMVAFFMPTVSGGEYVGSDVPESENYFRFHAWDGERNHGWCDFMVKVRVLRCDEPPLIKDGSYFRSSVILGSLLIYYCNDGFRLDGDSLQHCTSADTQLALWSSTKPYCEVRRCSAAPVVVDSSVSCVNTENFWPCTSSACVVNTRCTYACRYGYEVPAGSRTTIMCQSNGLWDDIPECVDTEPPHLLTCPDTQYVTAIDGSNGFRALWNLPTYWDNSGYVDVKQSMGPPPGSFIKEGRHIVSYMAQDKTSNTNDECVFNVIVHVPRCPPLLIVTHLHRPNCTAERNIGSSCSFSCLDGFSLDGSHHAVCRLAAARNPASSSSAQWQFEDIDKPRCDPEYCTNLTTSALVQVECGEWTLGSFCQPRCPDDYAFNPELPATMYSCPFANATWLPGDDVPSCAPTSNPIGTRYEFNVRGNVSCDISSDVLSQIELALKTDVSTSCVTCSVESSIVSCLTKRSRRSTVADISFEISDVSMITSGDVNTIHDQYTERQQMIYQILYPTVEAGLDDELGNDTSVEWQRHVTVRFICPSGYITSRSAATCVACTAGTYHNTINGECSACPKATYQTDFGMAVCTPCPDSMSTAATGSSSPSQCKPMCRLGEISPTGVQPCVPCDRGFYQDAIGQASCLACPTGTTSADTGSVGPSQCTSVDMSFRSSLTTHSAGLDLTLPFASTPNLENLTITFWLRSDLNSSRQPILIFGDNDSGITVELTDDGEIRADINRETDVTVSQPNNITWMSLAVTWDYTNHVLAVHFLNTIDTLLTAKEYAGELDISPPIRLRVPSGTTGDITQLNIWSRVLDDSDLNELSLQCHKSIAGDVLSWHDVINRPESEAFLVYGSQCDDTDECTSSPCIHGACTDMLDGFKCTCEPGYTGAGCDEDIDECESHVCRNNATCVNGLASYLCICNVFYTGKFCELKLIAGGWSAWTDWGPCSRTCDGGIQRRNRFCNQPVPANGGAACHGDTIDQSPCNEKDCPVCQSVTPPKNGFFGCKKTIDMEQLCEAKCLPGFEFTEQIPTLYTCGPSTGYMWTGQATKFTGSFVLPSCSLVEVPEKITLSMTIPYESLSCDTDSDATEIKSQLAERMQEMNNALNCMKEGTCTTNMAVINCDDVITTGTSRRKRAAAPVQITLDVTSEIKTLELNTNKSESGNITMADIMAVAEHSVSELRSALDSLELAGQQLKKDGENGNLSVMVGGKRHDPAVKSTSMMGKLVCPPGTAQKASMCVACSPGTYYNNTFCVPCPVATYQSQERQLQCTDCPSGQTTADRGASTLEQCIVFCERGTYLESNMCIACPRGSYQPVFMQTECIRCKDGFSTQEEGAIEETQCTVFCERGTYLESSMCIACQRGSYQPVSMQTGCIRCKDGFTTQEDGAIEETQCKATHINTDDDGDGDGTAEGKNVGIIVGVVCSAIVAIASTIIVIVICKRRGKPSMSSRQQTSTSSWENVHDGQELQEHEITEIYYENVVYDNAEAFEPAADYGNDKVEQIRGAEGGQDPEPDY